MSGEPAAGAAAADAAATTADTGTAATATATAANVLADAKVADATAATADATAAKAGDEGSKADGAKAADDGKAADADKPVEYTDFTMPEGVEVDAATLGEAKTLLAGMKLPQDEAQKLVDFYAGKIKAHGDAQVKAWTDLQEKWVSAFKADKEIGGDNVQATMDAWLKAEKAYGTPGLREALIMTGAGNHPEIIRFVARVGRDVREDTHVVAAGASAATKSAAQVIYGDSHPSQSNTTG